MTTQLEQARVRFLATLEIVRRELNVLKYSHEKLFSFSVDRAWVESLDNNMKAAETLEAFVSRFGRLQDTIGDKLIPRALTALAEHPGSMLDNLNKAERLHWLEDVNAWLSARELRNKLVHEYMTDENQFAKDINSSAQFYTMFHQVYLELLKVAEKNFGVTENELREYL